MPTTGGQAISRAEGVVIVLMLGALAAAHVFTGPLFNVIAALAFLIGVVAVLEMARHLRAFVTDYYPLFLGLVIEWSAVLHIIHAAKATTASPAVAHESSGAGRVQRLVMPRQVGLTAEVEQSRDHVPTVKTAR